MKRWLTVILAAVIACFVLVSCGNNANRWQGTSYWNKVDASTMNLAGKPLYPSSHAEMYTPASFTVTITTPGTYYMVQGNAIVYEAEDFDTTNTVTQLVYTGPDTKHFLIIASLAVASDTVNVLTDWSFYINGVPHVSAAAERFIATPGDTGSISMNNLEQLKQNDYVELWVTADKACTLTIPNLVFDIVSVN